LELVKTYRMNNFTRFGVLLLFMAMNSMLFAQEEGTKKSKKKSKKAAETESVVEEVKEPVTETAGTTSESGKTDSSAAKKDPQNQTQFMQEDMQAEKFSYQQRKSVSTPLMMRYDLDGAQ
jgi:hypothetical protein